MKEIKPFKLERFYTEHEFKSKYLLCASDCESFTIAEILSLESSSINAFGNLRLGYTETPGSYELREAICSLYKKSKTDDILVHTGAQEAIFLFLSSYLSKDDHVIVQTPCYQSFLSVPEHIGCRISEWKARLTNKWEMDLEELEHSISDQTKLIIINSPHNPTGHHFTNEGLNQLVCLARKHNIVIFCDEVYRHLEFDEKDRIPAISDIYENGVSLGVMSKAFGLAGLRIGWLATPRKDILDTVAVLKEYTSICNSGPAEFLSAIALKNKDHILTRNVQIIKRNLLFADSFFSEYEDVFKWVRPMAGPVAFVKLHIDQNSNRFIKKVLRSRGVLLLPGEIFDNPGFFRMGFGRSNFCDVLDMFSLFMKKTYIKSISAGEDK